MTTPRDPDRLIRAFLDEGSIELPDRAYDAVRDHIERTRQRAVIGPWKEPHMPAIARFGVVAAAMLMAAAIGFGVLSGGGRQGPPPPPSPVIASPSPTIVPTATPFVAAVPPDYRWPMALGPGTYQTDLAYEMRFGLRFTVGDGWTGYDISLQKGGTVAIRVLYVEDVFANGCDAALLDPPAGPSVDDLANAIAAMPAIEATTPVDATLLGADGKVLEYTIRSDAGCSPSVVRIAQPACEANESADAVCHTGGTDIGAELAPDELARTWVMDTGGRGRIVVQAITTPSATASDIAELQAVLDSLEIVRTLQVTQEPIQPAP